MKKFGFTLAEVLVTLGIIGVVASLTMPTLIQNHQYKTYSTGIQKVYTELSQALIRKINDVNAISLSEAGFRFNEDNTVEKDFLNTYFKPVKRCDNGSDCFAASYQTYKGAIGKNINKSNIYAITLSSGAVIGFKVYGKASYPIHQSDRLQEYIARAVVDINGVKGPNTLCKDYFEFFITNDGKIASSDDLCIGNLIKNGWQMNEAYLRNPGTF